MNRGLLIVGVLYGLLAIGYNLATPYGAAPDEGAHLAYVKTLAAGRLPVLDVTGQQERHVAYEAHQSPLAYALAVPVWLAARALGAPEPVAAKAVRCLSIVWGGIGLLAIGWLVRAALPLEPRGTLLLAVGFAALLPMRLAVSAAISNDPLAESVATAALALMVTMVRRGIARRRALALGLVLGIALLTKISLILLLPTAAIALVLAAVDEEPRATSRRPADSRPAKVGPALQAGAIVFGLALAIGGPWLVRNQWLYGDPLANRAFVAYFQDTPRWDPSAGGMRFHIRGEDALLPMSAGDYWLRAVAPVTFASFWGAFGHLERPELFLGIGEDEVVPRSLFQEGTPAAWLARSWLYPSLALLSLAAAIGCGIRWVRGSPRRTRSGRSIALVLGVAWLLVVAGFLRFNAVFYQAQGRYLFLAMGPIALAMAVGWRECVPQRWRDGLTAGLLAAMAALAVYALVGVVGPAFE